MSIFVDTGILVGAALARDRRQQRAAEILSSLTDADPFATDHVIVEAWALINGRAGYGEALRFWRALRNTPLRIESVTSADLEHAQAIAEVWIDHEFDIVDCTSFALMERLSCRRATSFAKDFAVYRYGPDRANAFEIIV